MNTVVVFAGCGEDNDEDVVDGVADSYQDSGDTAHRREVYNEIDNDDVDEDEDMEKDKDKDDEKKKDDGEWVSSHCYLKRSFFHAGAGTLVRVSSPKQYHYKRDFVDVSKTKTMTTTMMMMMTRITDSNVGLEEPQN